MSIEPSSLLARMRRRLGAGVDFGSFGTTAPIGREFGYERGRPIDRYYIESWLERHAFDIRGHALEMGEGTYCQRFGGERVTRQEVLHVRADPAATLVGDLAAGGLLPAAGLDSMVLIHTLQLIYDMRAAVAEIHRGLAPGGVALVTVPGISPIEADGWSSSCCWSLTERSAQRLFEDEFGVGKVQVETFGNVYAATAVLQGLAFEEVDRRKLDVRDPCYPVVVAVRAVRTD